MMYQDSNTVVSTELAMALQGLEFDVPCACNRPEACTTAILDEIIGTKLVRKGPRPDQQSSAMINVIQKYVDTNAPIPFMTPWGSEKPDGGTIDIAELCALRTIQCLDARVRKHYAPGITCNIRVEDVSAPHLFFERADAARKEAELYSNAFENLVRVLDCRCVNIRRESTRVTEERFNEVADSILPCMEKHLQCLDSERAFADLKAMGWKTSVTHDMVGEYLDRYYRLYPDKSIAEHLHILARYFSGVLARNKLGLRGDDASWGGSFIDLSFVEPSRKTGHCFPTRVYYRTIPANVSGNHVPPWRAKGYVVIDTESGIIRPRVASFHEKIPLVSEVVTLHGNGTFVNLRSDWQEI
jgi:hypothetical protein